MSYIEGAVENLRALLEKLPPESVKVNFVVTSASWIQSEFFHKKKKE